MCERTEKSTCFSSCSTPEACQTGRKSSLGCFLPKSSGGRRAWAALCTYLWYWSPERVKKKKKKIWKNQKLINTPFRPFLLPLSGVCENAYCFLSRFHWGSLGKPTVFNWFSRIISCPVRLHVAVLHLATRLAPCPPENDTTVCLFSYLVHSGNYVPHLISPSEPKKTWQTDL